VSQILIDLLYSMLVKKNVAARNFTQVLSKFNDFLISRFDVSKATILFDSLYFTMEYSKSIKICDTFLTCPPRQKLDSSYLEYVEDIMTKSFHQIFALHNLYFVVVNIIQIGWDQEPPIFLSS
jgi:hypothetical protein